MRILLRDIRYAFRTLSKAPGFTAVAVLTLALGIGANTAIFSIVYAVLLRPLPYKDPGRLVFLPITDTRPNGETDRGASYPDFETWRAQSRSFEYMAAFYRYGWAMHTLTGTDEPEKVRAGFVSADFFPMMGVAPALGRTFASEEVARRERVVVLSHGLWQRRFGSSAAALGTDLEVEGARFRVIGVMPAQFQFPFEDAQFWAPVSSHGMWRDAAAKGARFMVAGRLRKGISPGAAQAEMSAIAERIRLQFPDSHPGYGVGLIGVREYMTANIRPALLVLFGAVTMVLLIACANLANLFLARGSSRARELAVRAALGAGRMRLVTQLLAESAVVSLLAGSAGLLLAAPAIGVLKAFAPADIPRLAGAGLDGGTLLFTFGVSLGVAMMFGMAPAWRMSRTDPNDALKAGGRSAASGPHSSRTHGALVAAEFAVAVTLLTGAGLLVRSLVGVLGVDPGFRPERILSLSVGFPRAANEARTEGFHREALARLQRIPGVRHVAWARTIFFLDGGGNFTLRHVEGRLRSRHRPGRRSPGIRFAAITSR